MINHVIGAVIVTYNRIDKLKKALECFEKQTYLPAFLVVVDNASTDGTDCFLDDWAQDQSLMKKYILHTGSNLGGSGGFHIGLKKAMEFSPEWIWVSDDDAYPEADAFERTNQAINELGNTSLKIGAITGAVIQNGHICTGHRRILKAHSLDAKQKPVPVEAYNKPFFEIDSFSYVGSVICKEAMDEVGLTEKDFFIWFDDTEHSLRIRQYGKIYCVPSVRVVHDVIEDVYSFSWKNYYGLRNELYMVKKLFSKKNYRYKFLKKMVMASLHYLKKATRVQGVLEYTAILDAEKSRLGIHPVYKPGWKPE